MQNSYRFTRSWQAVIRKSMGVFLNRTWLLPVAMLIVVLGIGFTTPSTAIQAQDGGTGSGISISAHFVLQVDASDPKLNNLCLGQSVLLPVTVALQTIEFTGGGYVGDWRVRSAAIDPVVANPAIVSAVQSTAFFGDAAPNTPFRTGVTLTGQEMGSTTITLNATIQSSISRFYTDEVGLPLSATSLVDPVSVPVRVIPCRLQVRTGSLWQTTVAASGVLLSATSTEILISSASGVFRSNNDATTVRWFSVWNRPRGCLMTDSTNDEGQGVAMRAEIIGDELRLTLTFQPLVSVRILPTRCPGGFTETGRVPYLDNDPGGWHEGREIARDATWTPESRTYDFSIAGLHLYNRVSRTYLQPLERRSGSVNGWITITVELLPSINNP